MVLVIKDGLAVDVPQIYFIQAQVNITDLTAADTTTRWTGPVLIGESREPNAAILQYQQFNPWRLIMLSHRLSEPGELSAIRLTLEDHDLGRGWFAGSPEVMEYALGHATAPGFDRRARRSWRKLDESTVVEIWRLHFAERMEQRLLASRYGLSQGAVSKIIRGQNHSELFKRTPAPRGGAQGQDGFYISLAREPYGPRYFVPGVMARDAGKGAQGHE